jgi:hypothetical protein
MLRFFLYTIHAAHICTRFTLSPNSPCIFLHLTETSPVWALQNHNQRVVVPVD